LTESGNDCTCDDLPAISDKKLIKGDNSGNSCTYLGATQECSVWCTENCGGPCSNCETESGNDCTCDDLPAISDKKLIKGDGSDNSGNSCSYLGETQECSVWCTDNCGGPCSNCLTESGNDCACDDLPANSDKKLIKSDGNSCTYLGATQQCSVWCTDNCGGPCSNCLTESGNDCTCDDLPAISDKKLIKSDGNSCTYLGETQQCSVWCTENCGGPCSNCLTESGNDCTCDDLPAISDKKLIKSDGNSCTYLGETQQCSVWCTDNCGGPCSNCLTESGNDCTCDDLPAISDKKLIKDASDNSGNSCTYLGETQECSVWCTDNCGGPCSSCLTESGNDCACDDLPAISDIAIKNGVKVKSDGNSCTYLGATQQCSVWCTDNCGGPCSNCLTESGNDCTCDDLPAISSKKL